MAAYTEEQINDKFEAVINDIEEGNSLRKALGFYNISSATFYQWLDGNDERKKRYARACEDRADKLFEEILEIADKQDKDVYEVDGVVYTDHNVINRSRLQVDARKWMAAKMNPKKFGDKVDMTTNGKDLPPATIIKWGDKEIRI